MEDLKIVFYIIVAIVWVVYNNYRKLTQQAKKRDVTKPPPEVIVENWPPVKPAERKPTASTTPSWPSQPKPAERKPTVSTTPSWPSQPKPAERKPTVSTTPSWPSQPKPAETIRKTPLPRREPLRSPKIQRPAKQERPSLIVREGGNIKPSKIVQFEEEAEIHESENLVIQEIKNSDFRQAIILSEILKRPYN